MKSIIKIVVIATLLFGTSAVFTACNNEENELSQNQQGRYWKQKNGEQITKKVAESGWYHIFIEKRDANGNYYIIEIWVYGTFDTSTGTALAIDLAHQNVVNGVIWSAGTHYSTFTGNLYVPEDRDNPVYGHFTFLDSDHNILAAFTPMEMGRFFVGERTENEIR